MPADEARSLRPAFALLWLSETAFDLGSALMAFALGVWIFEHTGSAEQFSEAILAASAPALLMTPIAGAMIDRLDRRWVIAGCDLASVLLVAVLGGLVLTGKLAAPHLFAFNAASAVVSSIRTPAFSVALSSIVPKDRLTQASGLVGGTQSLLQIGAPLLAGYLMGFAGLTGVIAVECLLLLGGAVAVFGALSRARHAIRGVAPSAPNASMLQGTLQSFGAAVRYLREVPPMAGLAAYGILQETMLALAISMMTPLVLSTHPREALGMILSAGSVGSLAASLLLVAFPVRKRLMLWVLAADAVLSLAVLVVGSVTSTAAWAGCAFIALFAGTVSGACGRAIWMRKTPQARRGSIFALVTALNLLALCIAMLAGGHVGERIFEPVLREGGTWADGIGAYVGTGKGRGLGFMFIVCGGASFLLSMLAMLLAPLRRLDEFTHDEPDALPTEAVAT